MNNVYLCHSRRSAIGCFGGTLTWGEEMDLVLAGGRAWVEGGERRNAWEWVKGQAPCQHQKSGH